MKVRGWLIASAGVVLAMTLLGLLALTRLPDGALLPTHWNAAGEVDSHMPARMAVAIMPAMTALIGLLFAILPGIEPLQRQLAQSAPVLKVAWAMVLVVLGMAHLMILAPAFGWHLAPTLLLVGVGIGLVALGNVLPKSRPGYFVGIRTPWTLVSTDVWIATHRLGGRCFITAGVVMVLAALSPIPPHWRAGLTIGAIAFAAIVPIVWSWWLWRGLGKPPARPPE
ncbi:SdpI family protein [Novosphingobium album (ex Liu et al. 2023)]|uniref:SdpI family protein n=1 Tax=Novosphingobium album (ex Liu et al. 2023) TaxID=3031130 RepID=A0ABT5WLE7_9SPHN|nr:SdpI family protein [Novosphingobium album (ex Liu et al. 2023)]MDE8650872.1 SdpI family protein [Novosphingobium album (ex Liu et al. 2023)]